MTAKPIALKSCPKKYVADLDKAASPEETARRAAEILRGVDLDIVSEVRRVDNGRLDIPVYISVCGKDAREVMPTRKQMGKGSSPAQARASALMELIERYSFFSFWGETPDKVEATWSEAEKIFGDSLIPIEEVALSAEDGEEAGRARAMMDLAKWEFYPATRLRTGEAVWLPADWFRMLGEFNGSSAGNAPEESLLQGLAELVERDVCRSVDREKLRTPAIDPESIKDPVAKGLLDKFKRNGVSVVLKDFSLGRPLPTVGVLAWDPATFPERSEIVFTAGTASSPAKAAIRALTEAAQLGGDFNSGACYEASGLPKFKSMDECQWLLEGGAVPLDSLPSAEREDIRDELLAALNGLAPLEVYAIDTTNPRLGIPAHYCIAPGLKFRERDRNSSLGLFVGRKLSEGDTEAARDGLEKLDRLCPGAFFTPFFKAMVALRAGEDAASGFAEAYKAQPDDESRALAAFYAGHAHALKGNWAGALPWLEKATALSPDSKEYRNLLGAALYNLKRHAEAESQFNAALKIDKGSAIDLANRGVCRKFLGRLAEAREDLETALALDPSLDFAKKHLRDLAGERRGADAP